MASAQPSFKWTRRLAGPVLILLAAAVAAAPIWLHGPVAGDDFEFHFVSWMNAHQSWLNGIPYPHWAVSPNFGAGEPRFVFYPPLTWMLGAALGFLLPWTLTPVALTFLLLAGTGIATRALARQFLPGAPATLAGCAALFSGYALFTAYDRTAFGELAGGFWIPLVLLFSLRDRHPGARLWARALDGSTLLLALAIAGAWLSDAPVGVMASYLLAGVALAAALTARAWFPLVRATVAVVLGIGLTAVYLIPAAWEQRWVDIQQAIGAEGDPGLRIENNWLFPHHIDPALHMRDQALRAVSWIAVSMVAAALLCAATAWLSGKLASGNGPHGHEPASQANKPISRQWWLPLALVPAVVLFLQRPVSLPVWNALPRLRFLQFPWRWLLVVEAPLGVFFAAAVWPRSAARRWQRPVVAALCAAFFLGATVFATHNFFRDGPEADDMGELLSQASSGAGFVGTDEYAPPGAENTLVPSGLPDACLADNFDQELGVALTPDQQPVWRPEQNSCLVTATAAIHRPEQIRLSTVALRAGFLILRLRGYPAWRISVNGRLVTGLQPRQDGLIALPVPQGPVTVAVDWTTTPDMITGRCVSLAALLGLAAMGLAERKLSRSGIPLPRSRVANVGY